MKRHESKYNSAVKELSDYIHKNARKEDIRPEALAKITRVLEGVERMDEMISQKDQLLAQKEQLLIQKDKNLGTLKETGTVGEQKEFVDALHKIYPNWYPERLEDWSSDTWGKQVIDRGDFKTIQANLPAYRQQVLEKEFIDILHELYPSWYPVNFKDWPADSWGKEVIDGKNYKAIEGNLPIYKQWLANKKELIEILPKLHPESYPVNYEEWTNQYAKGLLDKGDYKTIEQSLPIYRKQLARKEFIEILPKLYPNDYPVGFENWTYQWGKGVVDRDEFETIKKNLPTYKKLLLQKEFIDSMHQVNPKDYPARFEDWSNKTLGKEIVEKEDYKAMEQSLSDNRQKLKEREKEELLSQKENELKKLAGKDQLLNDREQEIAKIKELLSIKELEAQNKDQLLLAKELEKQELVRQKEIEKQELLAQKEKEIHNKSLVKNQVIGELQEDIGLKEKEAYKLQIELLTKQLEAAREIGKHKENNAELVEQNEILGLKMQYYDMEVKNRETEKEIMFMQKQKLSFLVSQKDQEFQNLLIQKEIEQKELLMVKELAVTDKSFEKNQIIEQLREDITNLKQKLLDNQPIYRSIYIEDRSCQPGDSLVERQMASLDLSSINLSPINHGGQNQIVGNIIGNFDNQHITHSVVLGGEGSESFEIIQQESFH